MATLRTWTGSRSRRVIIAPGLNYGPDAPLLWYARTAAMAAGWSVTDIFWEGLDLPGTEQIDVVNAGVIEALDANRAKNVVLVTKSVGSLAMNTAVERGLPGVWLTPLIGEVPDVRMRHLRDHIEKLTGEQLFVGGTTDISWDSTAVPARFGSLAIPGGDHALQIEGEPLRSIEALGTVTEAVGEFLGRFTR